MFVTSETCKDITPEQAPEYILGYTVGNNISCRKYQAPEACGWQFYFAKAFDKFAPMGPVLLSPEALTKDVKLVTKVNGDVVQESKCLEDMIFSINDILSWMSQETTIPAGTAVMTGTPAGVGLFRKPQLFLKDGDVVEVELAGVGAGVLQNKIVVVYVLPTLVVCSPDALKRPHWGHAPFSWRQCRVPTTVSNNKSARLLNVPFTTFVRANGALGSGNQALLLAHAAIDCGPWPIP